MLFFVFQDFSGNLCYSLSRLLSSAILAILAGICTAYVHFLIESLNVSFNRFRVLTILVKKCRSLLQMEQCGQHKRYQVCFKTKNFREHTAHVLYFFSFTWKTI